MISRGSLGGESAAPARAMVNMRIKGLWRNIEPLRPVFQTGRENANVPALFYTVGELPPVHIPYIEEGRRVFREFA